MTVEISVTNKTDNMSTPNGTAIIIRVVSVNENHHTVFLRIYQIEEVGTLLQNMFLSDVIYFQASFCLYGFDNDHDTLSVNSYPGDSAIHVNTVSATRMIVCEIVLIKGAKVPWINGRLRP